MYRTDLKQLVLWCKCVRTEDLLLHQSELGIFYLNSQMSNKSLEYLKADLICIISENEVLIHFPSDLIVVNLDQLHI